MIYLRAALAGTAVHTLRGKWCPQAYADLMKSSGARWSSLVPTQVVDLVSLGLRRAFHRRVHYRRRRRAGHGDGTESTHPWLARSAELRHDGSRLPISHGPSRRFLPYGPPFPSAPLGSSDGQRRPPALPGERQIVRPPADAGSWRVPSGKSRSAGVVEHPRPGAPGRAFADLSAPGGQTCQSPGGTGGSGCRSGRFAPAAFRRLSWRQFHIRAGMELVACGPSSAPLEQACLEWNASAPGPQRIRAVMETPIPLTVMGKLDRNRPLPVERSSGKVEGNLLKGNLPGIFIKRIRT